MKMCRKCKREKDESEFYRRSKSKDGLTSQCRSCIAEYNASNREANLLRCKQWYANNKDAERSYKKRWRKLHHEDEKHRQQRWYSSNKKYIANKKQDKYQNDINFRLKSLLRMRLNSAINNNHKTGSAIKDLGCSIEELKIYLESKFQPGMSWDNHGEWHIDHIIPLSSFDLSDPEQLKAACHYTNLQPLWAKDNLSKGNRTINTLTDSIS